MTKTAWNQLLVGYKGQVSDFGALVRNCIAMESAGANVEQILDNIAIAHAPPKTVGLADQAAYYAVFTADRFESGTYDQMDTVARLPVFVRGALMPDAHPGYAMPIGGVAGLRGAIAPNLVGVDIGCRVSLSLFLLKKGYTFASARKALEDAVVQVTAFGFKTLDAVQDHPVMHNKSWDEIPFLRNLKDKAQAQLGTSGGGNHFVDLVKVRDENGNEYLGIMTHSGSRGAGAQAAKYYSQWAVEQCQQRGINVPKDYAYLDANSPIGQEYWRVMNLMGEYSLACHELIMARFYHEVADIVEKYMPGIGTASRIAIKEHGRQTKIAETIYYFTNAHNLAWIEKVDGEWLYVHRKGATPASAGQIGIIPGSSGSNSYVVIGKGEKTSLESASHGAGRPRSRTASKALHDNAAWLAHMEKLDIHYHGVAPDETVYAYKDIESVMAAQKPLVTKWMTMQPFFVAMGGMSDDGD